jgi:5-methylcytosine-specific restriction endonuclease McrA
MISTHLSSLDSAALARRLADLAGDERRVQVDFLLHLDEFDRRRAYLEAGFRSLWDYCLGTLHLREGAAGRRIGAMRVLRRFPALEPALRDGRLCLSTASLLGQVLTPENLDDLVAGAAYRTKAQVEELVVSIKPRPAPADGVRRLAAKPELALTVPAEEPVGSPLFAPSVPAEVPMESSAPAPTPTPVVAAARPLPEVRPVAEDRWSLRVTLDVAAKDELEALKALLSHKIPDGDLAAVLREAIRCGIETHGKRRGAVAPARERKPRPSFDPRNIPASVRREVWKRDGGRCTFAGPDGRRCESRWQLQFDHVDPVALGGGSTADKLRLRCRPHNLLEAERVFGREHMDRFRRAGLTIAGDSEPPRGASMGEMR